MRQTDQTVCPKPKCTRRGPYRARPGVVTFFLVLALAVLTLAASLAMVAGTVAQQEACMAARDGRTLEWTARSGLQWALWRTYSDPLWRTTLPVNANGAWTTQPLSVGSGSFTVYGTDPVDGDLTDDPTDPVSLTVRASVGQTVVEYLATLEPYTHPVLAFAVFSANKHIVFKNAPVIEAPVRGNAALSDDKTTTVDVTAGGRLETLTGQNVSNTLLPYTTFVPEEMPSLAPDFDWYASRATLLSTKSISRASLTESSLYISGDVFPPNPDGIYLIDGSTDNVSLKDVYLRGTLLIDRADGVEISGGFRCELGPLGGPTLLVRTKPGTQVDILIDRPVLDEPSDGVDYNADGDTVDVIASRLKGLIWTNRRLQIQPSVSLISEGLLAGNHVHINGRVYLRKYPGQESWLVPGTLGPGLRIRPGSVRRAP